MAEFPISETSGTRTERGADPFAATRTLPAVDAALKAGKLHEAYELVENAAGHEQDP